MSTYQSKKEGSNSARAYYDAEIHALKEKVKELEGRSTSKRGSKRGVAASGETASSNGSGKSSSLTLDHDTFTMMMTSRFCSCSYWVGLITLWCVEALGSLIAVMQVYDEKLPMVIPVHTNDGVRVVQFFSLFFIMVLQSNNLSAVQVSCQYLRTIYGQCCDPSSLP